MKVEQFAMERMQSTWENRVQFNLSESGVRPLTPRELLGEAGADLLLDQPLVYTQSNGTPELRRAIAAMYPGATDDHIEVTNGGSEANYMVVWRLVEPDDEIVMLVPNYMQTWGLARAFGGTVRPWPLIEDRAAGRWRPDLPALDALVSPKTRLIILCTPNNPTGARLTGDELDHVARAAARHGSWVLSDEIYRGAELDGVESPSMWGRYERVVVTSGLSKAYGLPGLRIGWIAGPPDLVETLWSYHDYTTIAPGALSDRLARLALEPGRRASLIERTRGILRANLPVLEGWLRAHDPAFSWIRPEASAILFVRYHHGVNSTELVTRLRDEHSVLVVPGDHFGMDGYLRLGFGEPQTYLQAGLERLHRLLSTLPAPA
ncbi:MAG: aminotransferase class I/II-fold pyridoxal phosphate-dependent enzyme [Acidobacteriota bacterium]